MCIKQEFAYRRPGRRARLVRDSKTGNFPANLNDLQYYNETEKEQTEMKKRILSLLLAGLLTFSLTACGDKPTPPSQAVEEAATPSAEETQPSPSPASSGAAELSLPERDYRPWQSGYIKLLTRLRGEELGIESAYAALAAEEQEPDEALTEQLIYQVTDCCGLYDVDKDDVPELFVTFGNADASHSTRCYTFREGEVVLAGEFPSEYCCLYTYPGENGFLLGSVGLSGHSEVTAYSLENGTLSEGRQLFSEDNAEKLTYAYDVVPGAVEIDSYPTRVAGGIVNYYDSVQTSQPMTALVLPVCDWYDGLAVTGSDSEKARAAILAVLEDGAPFINVPLADFGLYGPIGATDLAEFAGRQNVEECALPYELAGYFWQDLNRDGQEECLIQLTSMYEDGSWCGNVFLVLSEQDGEVYGYNLDIASLCCPYTDGTIRHNSICCALAFWKEQCYMYDPAASDMPSENYVRYDEAAQSAEWIPATQAEG